MDIIKRNFYRQLCIGAFGVGLKLEPMSAFKWNKIKEMAAQKNVLCYIDNTVERDKFQPAQQE